MPHVGIESLCPVTANTTEPRSTNPCGGSAIISSIPWRGSRAWTMAGKRMNSTAPRRPSVLKPHDDDRGEIPADMTGAVTFDKKQGDQQSQRQWPHVRFERRGRDFEALGSAEH